MLPVQRFSETIPSRQQRFPCRWRLSSADTRKAQEHLLEPEIASQYTHWQFPGRALASIKQKLGVGSSPSAHHPELKAPVVLPGLMKNFPSSSYASKRCVPPHSNTSTSICLAAINKLSASAGGIIVWPCVKPIRNEPCVTTFESARFGASTSKSPLTI